MTEKFQKLFDTYPFLSIVQYSNAEFVGIIQNQDQLITSFYNWEKLRSDEEKKLFIELAEQWWWESNRRIPINIFLYNEWQQFRHTLVTFNNKDLTVVAGHVVSLNELSQKRVKRKNIQLVKIVK